MVQRGTDDDIFAGQVGPGIRANNIDTVHQWVKDYLSSAMFVLQEVADGEKSAEAATDEFMEKALRIRDRVLGKDPDVHAGLYAPTLDAFISRVTGLKCEPDVAPVALLFRMLDRAIDAVNSGQPNDVIGATLLREVHETTLLLVGIDPRKFCGGSDPTPED